MRRRKIESPLRRMLTGVCITLLVILAGPPLLGLGMGMLLVSGWEHESDQRIAPAREALQAVGMGTYMGSYDVLTGPGAAAFHLSQYDNHVENTDLRAALMADALAAEGWTVAPVTADEYAAQIPPDMAFLMPQAGLVFDASYRAEGRVAFFDQASGLMVYFGPEGTPEPKVLRLKGVDVPTGGWAYGMETHGGFMGDGLTYWAFVVPEEYRSALEADLSAHADWHAGSVSQAEYARLQERCFYEVPDLFPGELVVFDLWYYVDDFARQYPEEEIRRQESESFPAVMRDAGAGRSGNWTIGFYDRDTGLLIWYEYDS